MFYRMIGIFRAMRLRGEARRDYGRLLRADEALLRDIGVTRGDVRRALRRGGMDNA